MFIAFICKKEKQKKFKNKKHVFISFIFFILYIYKYSFRLCDIILKCKNIKMFSLLKKA